MEKKEINDLRDSERGVLNTEVTGEMKKAYLDYAMSVIVSRAIPSVEDGLKPVQRRILYAMHQMGLKPNTSTKKSARIVGDVIGKFHPHGDSAVYDAMVRMAQDFSLRYPLVFGQGNFGCFTADTKVKLADGRNLSFLDLVKEYKQGKRNFIFTVNENGFVDLAEVKNPRKTFRNKEIMKVVLDNGEEIKCTLNHRFMLKDKTYKEAQNLKPDDSLMPAYFRISTSEDDSKTTGYEMVFQPRRDSWDFVHHLSDKWNLKNNLYPKSSGRMKKRNLRNWKKPSYQRKMRKFLSEVNKEYLKNNPLKIEEMRLRAGKKKFLKICNYLLNKGLQINKQNYEKIRKEIFGIRSFTSWDLGIEKYFDDDKNLALCELNKNHKVVRVEFLKEYEDVYDLEVPETHNFALSSGVFVHNSIDGDPPAAYRYTEAKLMQISSELLQDIEKETVKFDSNFDNSLKEPSLLPGKLPTLLLNGASGIAVGMATNIPPHNLTEVCESIVSYIKNPNISLLELIEIVKGPDFPTGGSITGNMNDLYKTGKGRLVVRGKVTTEKIKTRVSRTRSASSEGQGKEAVVITEIPYMLNKSSLVTQIAGLVQNKKIKDVSDLRDESAKGKIRIVLELKKGADSKFVINSLYKYTRLQDSFNANLLALVNGQPRVLNLKDFLIQYVEYRKLMITNRSKFELKKAKERQEIVEGLLVALKNIDSVVELIKKSKGKTEAVEGLIKKFKLTKKQAEAVLETKLQQLTSLEVDKLKKESEELKKKISELEKILGDIKEVLKIIVKEVNELKNKYGDTRKTSVLKSIKEIGEKDLVQEKDVVITLTDKGYCKRMDLESYREQKRGGRGSIGSNLAIGDFVRQLITCSTHDYLLFFTSRGRVLWLKAYEIPNSEKYSKGRSINNLLTLKNETITKVISVDSFEDSLFMATKKGVVKRISLKHFSKPRASGIKVIALPENESDSLIGVDVVKDSQEVLLATKKGQAIKFNAKDVREMGRTSYGVTGIKLGKDDEVVSLEVLDTDAIVTISRKGYGKRTYVEDYRKTSRGGKGVINIKVSEKTGEVVTTVAVNNDDNIIVTTAKGIVIRMSLKNIRVMGRATQGVRLVKLQEKDYVTDLIKVQIGE